MHKLRMTLLGLLCATPLVLHAQNQLDFTFKGVSYETNGAGHIAVRVVDEKKLLKDVATAVGNLDSTRWKMVYHIGGNELGDTIEIVDSTTGVVLDTYLGLYFGESLGRLALKGNTQEKRIDYLYTKQNSHSMGASFTNKQKLSFGKGVTRWLVEGRLQFVLSQGSSSPRIYSGTFRTGRALSLKP